MSYSGSRLPLALTRIGFIGFGGGSALIPLFDKELVQDRGLLDRETFTRHTVVSNITPGGLPTKLGALAGLQLSGVWGGVAGGFIAALPGTLLAVAVQGLLAGASTAVRAIEYASVGIAAYIVAVLLAYVARVVGRSLPGIAIALLTFMVLGVNDLIRLVGVLLGTGWQAELPQLSPVGVVVLALALIAAYSALTSRRRFPRGQAAPGGSVPERQSGVGAALPAGPGKLGVSGPVAGPERHTQASLPRQALIASGILLAIGAAAVCLAGVVAGTAGLGFAGLIALSIVTLFGGGNAYIAVAAGFFVTSGMVAGGVFYGQIVPLANATPGPLAMKLAAAVGYDYGHNHTQVAAIGLAVSGFVIAVVISAVSSFLVLAGYETVGGGALMRDLSDYILPVICGMLVTTAISMVSASATLGAHSGTPAALVGWVALALTVGVWLVRERLKLPDLLLISLLAALTWAALSGAHTAWG